MTEEWQQQQEEMLALKKQLERLEAIARSVMTREAFQRYSNLKFAHPERAVKLLVLISQLVQSNKIVKVGDAELKLLLQKMEVQREQKIKFVDK